MTQYIRLFKIALSIALAVLSLMGWGLWYLRGRTIEHLYAEKAQAEVTIHEMHNSLIDLRSSLAEQNEKILELKRLSEEKQKAVDSAIAAARRSRRDYESKLSEVQHEADLLRSKVGKVTELDSCREAIIMLERNGSE